MSESRLQSLQARMLQARMAEIKGQIKSLETEYEKVSKERNTIKITSTVTKWIERLDFEIPDKEALRNSILAGFKEIPLIEYNYEHECNEVEYEWVENNQTSQIRSQISFRAYDDGSYNNLSVIGILVNDGRYSFISVPLKNKDIKISSWEDIQNLDTKLVVAAIIHHLRWNYVV